MSENGFVLLNSNSFNVHQLLQDLRKDWQIEAILTQEEEAFTLAIGEFLCIIALMPAAIPDEEAVHCAQHNYYCLDAVAIAQQHQAHLIVVVMNQSEHNELASMQLYSKIISCCLNQQNAIGVYTSGTVYSADFYQEIAKEYLIENGVPIMLWVYIGFGQTEQGNQLYTSGMTRFGKEEMEILNSEIDIERLHTSLNSICSYIIETDLMLKDGETIGFSEDQKWEISRSQSVYAPSEFSLKIQID